MVVDAVSPLNAAATEEVARVKAPVNAEPYVCLSEPTDVDVAASTNPFAVLLHCRTNPPVDAAPYKVEVETATGTPEPDPMNPSTLPFAILVSPTLPPAAEVYVSPLPKVVVATPEMTPLTNASTCPPVPRYRDDVATGDGTPAALPTFARTPWFMFPNDVVIAVEPEPVTAPERVIDWLAVKQVAHPTVTWPAENEVVTGPLPVKVVVATQLGTPFCHERTVPPVFVAPKIEEVAIAVGAAELPVPFARKVPAFWFASCVRASVPERDESERQVPLMEKHPESTLSPPPPKVEVETVEKLMEPFVEFPRARMEPGVDEEIPKSPFALI
jgi:hypothetical protein